MKGHIDVVKFLLQHGAVTSSLDTNGRIPLHYSCKNGHSEVTMSLIQHDESDINERDRENATPLHLACKYGFADLVSLLLGTGAEIQAKMANGESPLHIACQFDWPQVVEVLLKNNANRNAKDNDRFTPWHKAAQAGSAKSLDSLIWHSSVDVNLKGKDERSALTLACRAGHLDIVEILVESNTIIDIFDLGKRTPLHWAMSYGYTKIALCLLQKGSDPFRLDKNGQSPIQLAIHCPKLKAQQRVALVEYIEDQNVVLMRICRRVIRKALSGNMKNKLDSVHLPKKLKDYLYYCDLPLQ